VEDKGLVCALAPGLFPENGRIGGASRSRSRAKQTEKPTSAKGASHRKRRTTMNRLDLRRLLYRTPISAPLPP